MAVCSSARRLAGFCAGVPTKDLSVTMLCSGEAPGCCAAAPARLSTQLLLLLVAAQHMIIAAHCCQQLAPCVSADNCAAADQQHVTCLVQSTAVWGAARAGTGCSTAVLARWLWPRVVQCSSHFQREALLFAEQPDKCMHLWVKASPGCKVIG